MNFMNFGLGALNVKTVSVDTGVLDALRPLLAKQVREPEFAVINPKWNSDVLWISPNTQEGFSAFQSAFESLGIANHVRDTLDLEREPRMYAGFIVQRSQCSQPDFHLDWVDTGNQAFTFLTPFSADAAGFGLLYKKVTGTIGEYDYRPGEGILFGDHFVHSTKPGSSPDPVALLCFTFGTDKMKYWDRIRKTAGYQSKLLCQPDGQLVFREGKGRLPKQP